MTKVKLLSLAFALAMMSFFATPAASAQDGPTMTIDPVSVDAPGEQTFTLTGTGWTVGTIFVLPCTVPESGDPADISAETDCDSTDLTPVPIVDGGFTQEVTYEVPEGGMVIAGGDANGEEGTAVLITIGAADGGGDDGAGDDGDGDGDGAGDDAGAEEPVENNELPDTGAETAPLAVLGTAIVAAGAMIFGFSRKLND